MRSEKKIGSSWEDANEPSFCRNADAYRIKPEPEVIWVNKKNAGEKYVHASEERARIVANCCDNYEFIAKKFIEAPEE